MSALDSAGLSLQPRMLLSRACQCITHALRLPAYPPARWQPLFKRLFCITHHQALNSAAVIPIIFNRQIYKPFYKKTHIFMTVDNSAIKLYVCNRGFCCCGRLSARRKGCVCAFFCLKFRATISRILPSTTAIFGYAIGLSETVG